MRLLILGAGATGGFFGAHLARAARDVTFLVRLTRAEQLARDGLRVDGTLGKFSVPAKSITDAAEARPFDVVLLSCKSYDLQSAIAAIRPAVSGTTTVVPILNGLAHLDTLDAEFGRERVLGGTCHLSATLDGSGTVQLLSPFASMTIGPRDAAQSQCAEAIRGDWSNAGFELHWRPDIERAMWEKWVLLATLAGMTCLMRANIGEIVATDHGARLIAEMLAECCAVAAACGAAQNDDVVAKIRAVLTDPASTMSASMRRDLERGARIEADHIIGDLVRRGAAKGVPTPLLKVALTHLQAHQNRARG